MKVYLVREAGTTKVHGIFWADSIHDLFWAVDEMADPCVFEYAKLNRPSGIWTPKPMDEVEASSQFKDTPDDEDFEGFGLESFDQEGDHLMDAVFDQGQLRWRTFGDPGQYYRRD